MTLLPTKWGNFNISAYANGDAEQMPHLALISEKFNPAEPVYVRIHSECVTGDIFASNRCDCGEQLHEALKLCAEKGGVLIYLRQEGRGIGLINKLKAYNLQDEGMNTADANTHLGFDVDSRQYDIAINVLEDLKIKAIHLLTNNPLKLEAIKNSKIKIVSRIPLVIPANKDNQFYLKTKGDVMGHLF